MSTITKERLTELSRRENVGAILGEEIAELARIALASLEAEASGRNPVLAYADSYRDMANQGVESIPVWSVITDLERNIAPLFTAPPAPISVPAAMEMDDDFDSSFEHGKAVGWNACRAAMLQGADGKPELTVWYGAMPETNGKTNWTAILHRKGQHLWEGITIDRSEYPDRVRYEADRMRYLIGELSEEPDILEYDSEAHSGYVKPRNSPVIPDGWVMVPEDPTHEMLEAGDEQFGTYDVYRRMITAAPQQEVK